MFKIYDTECTSCGEIIEQTIEDNEEIGNCPICGGDMKRIFTTMNFKLLYNNKTDVCGWAAHGYEESQYYKNVKEARARGENVKSPDDKY